MNAQEKIRQAIEYQKKKNYHNYCADDNAIIERLARCKNPGPDKPEIIRQGGRKTDHSRKKLADKMSSAKTEFTKYWIKGNKKLAEKWHLTMLMRRGELEAYDREKAAKNARTL